jgi:diguanylate cyclase (GGDEF)-like protein
LSKAVPDVRTLDRWLHVSTDFRQPDGRRAARDREQAAKDRQVAETERRRAAAMLATACRDDLTGALTRRAGRERLRAEIIRAHRSDTTLCVAFLDVDGLKRVNDAHGHRAGDEILAAVGIALREGLRAYDSVIRYGGDEFVCVIPGVDEQTAAAAVNRAGGRAAELVAGASFAAGYASLQRDDDVDDIIHRADVDMYEQKRSPQRRTRPASTNNKHREVSASAPRPHRGEATIACGQCGGRIRLGDFSRLLDAAATRAADCPRCGETTVIQLSRPRLPG